MDWRYLLLGDVDEELLPLLYLPKAKEGKEGEVQDMFSATVIAKKLERKLKSISPRLKDKMLAMTMAEKLVKGEDPESIILFLSKGIVPGEKGNPDFEEEIKFGTRKRGTVKVEFEPLSPEEVELKLEEGVKEVEGGKAAKTIRRAPVVVGGVAIG